HSDADHPDIIRPPRPGGVGVPEIGKEKIRDPVLRLAPSQDVERLRRRKHVAALSPGGRLAADDIDAVDGDHAEDSPGPLAPDRNGIAMAGRSGDPALAFVRVDRKALPGA